MKLVWDESAWADYVWWQAQDRKVLKRINQLIADIQRNGNEGIGKPEPLKHGFQGYWSRRITDEHRLVYKIADDEIPHRRLPVPLRALTRESGARAASRHFPAILGCWPLSSSRWCRRRARGAGLRGRYGARIPRSCG